jgi:hypothetical protein
MLRVFGSGVFPRKPAGKRFKYLPYADIKAKMADESAQTSVALWMREQEFLSWYPPIQNELTPFPQLPPSTPFLTAQNAPQYSLGYVLDRQTN